MEALAATATLNMNAAPLAGLPRNFRRLAAVRPEFGFLGRYAPQRAAAEAYVADCFANAYGARVSSFAPDLFAMHCADTISAVAGIRLAQHENLFLEQYLDSPVEHIVGAAYNETVGREHVFELCNLAAGRPGVCYLLYVVLAHVMHRSGYRYAIFAGTRQVARIVSKLQFTVADLAPADPARLGEAAADWGNYYRTSPRVMAIDLDASLADFAGFSLQSAVANLFTAEIDALVAGVTASRAHRCNAQA